MKNIGKGIGNFISNPNAVRSAMGVPASEQTVDVKATNLGSEPIVKPKATPKQNLVPDPKKTGAITKKRRGRPKKFKTLAEVQADIDSRNPTYRSPITGGLLPGKGPKVESLEKVGLGEKQVKKKVKKQIKDEFDVDPKMKKAFMDALALPAKSAAVAMTDLLEKIPAPSKEASKLMNRNISKISQSFKLGAASSEVANDEADNDKKEDNKGGTILGGLLGRALQFIRGKTGGGDSSGGGGDQPQLPGSSPQQNLLPGAVGDPSYGRRAPYTGTADGIGLGDPKTGERAMQPIKKRKSLARKLFNMTPMGMAFNAGNKLFKGVQNIAQSKTFKNIKGIAGKAFGMTPVGMMAKFMMKNNPIMKRVFNKEQTTNLTELTDKTIQANRDSADEKTQKQLDLASGTGAAIAAASKSPPPQQAEGGALANPKIKGSPYIDVYNTTSQF